MPAHSPDFSIFGGECVEEGLDLAPFWHVPQFRVRLFHHEFPHHRRLGVMNMFAVNKPLSLLFLLLLGKLCNPHGLYPPVLIPVL